MLANRLRRWHQHLRKWARRTGVSCYRVYDHDIPDQPLVIDWYEGRVLVWAHPRKRDDTEEKRRLWLDEVQQAVAEGLGVAAEQIFFKERRRQKGLSQYEKLGEQRHEFVVTEAGLRFKVNLSDYLDTGLFLDHRTTRQRVGAEARDRRVLNLFAYTGSFSVHAAAGGAKRVTTVDLSNTYLEWGRENFRLNDLDPARHDWFRADVLRWLPDEVRRGGRYDLIICDPPTFSNSKGMEGVLDVDRDHPAIINQCLRLLSPGGVLYFSTNSRQFELLEPELLLPPVRELTPASIPEDFRNRRIHRCWRFETAVAS